MFYKQNKGKKLYKLLSLILVNFNYVNCMDFPSLFQQENKYQLPKGYEYIMYVINNFIELSTLCKSPQDQSFDNNNINNMFPMMESMMKNLLGEEQLKNFKTMGDLTQKHNQNLSFLKEMIKIVNLTEEKINTYLKTIFNTVKNNIEDRRKKQEEKNSMLEKIHSLTSNIKKNILSISIFINKNIPILSDDKIINFIKKEEQQKKENTLTLLKIIFIIGDLDEKNIQNIDNIYELLLKNFEKKYNIMLGLDFQNIPYDQEDMNIFISEVLNKFSKRPYDITIYDNFNNIVIDLYTLLINRHYFDDRKIHNSKLIKIKHNNPYIGNKDLKNKDIRQEIFEIFNAPMVKLEFPENSLKKHVYEKELLDTNPKDLFININISGSLSDIFSSLNEEFNNREIKEKTYIRITTDNISPIRLLHLLNFLFNKLEYSIFCMEIKGSIKILSKPSTEEVFFVHLILATFIQEIHHANNNSNIEFDFSKLKIVYEDNNIVKDIRYEINLLTLILSFYIKNIGNKTIKVSDTLNTGLKDHQIIFGENIEKVCKNIGMIYNIFNNQNPILEILEKEKERQKQKIAYEYNNDNDKKYIFIYDQESQKESQKKYKKDKNIPGIFIKIKD